MSSCTGTPEDVAACEESYTGQALQRVLSSRDPKRETRSNGARKRTNTPTDEPHHASDRPGRPAAQPQEHHRQLAARADDRLLRAERFGQEHRWPSTRSMPRGSAATSNRCRAMPGSSSARCRSRKSSTSAGCRRPSASNRRRPARARARPSAPSPRSTTICASSSPASASTTARPATSRSARRPPTRSSRRS